MKEKMAAAALAILLLMGLSACADIPPVDGPYESVEGQQVKMTAGEVEVIITLNDSRAAADLAGMLPLELELIERNDFAKGMNLPGTSPTSSRQPEAMKSAILATGIRGRIWRSFMTIYTNRPLFR